jgi:hypothetical protein
MRAPHHLIHLRIRSAEITFCPSQQREQLGIRQKVADQVCACLGCVRIPYTMGRRVVQRPYFARSPERARRDIQASSW